MDKAQLMDYINHDMADRFVAGLIEDMSDHLTEDQFKECIRSAFAEISKGCSDYEYEIERAIENSWVDVSNAYYDDEEDMDSVPPIEPYIKDRFYFVKIMFGADLEIDAIQIFDGLSNGLKKVSENKKYEAYKDSLIKLRNDMLDCMEKKEYDKWFDY